MFINIIKNSKSKEYLPPPQKKRIPSSLLDSIPSCPFNYRVGITALTRTYWMSYLLRSNKYDIIMVAPMLESHTLTNPSYLLFIKNKIKTHLLIKIGSYILLVGNIMPNCQLTFTWVSGMLSFK